MPNTKNIFEFNSQIKAPTNLVKGHLFKHLEVFAKVVEAGNLSEAARRLKITPSAVSKSLLKLETEVGVTLLKRTTRNLVLTEAGKYLYNQTLQMLAELTESIDKTKGYHSYPQGQLKITCSFAFASAQLMALFNEYKKKYPQVNLVIDLNDQLINLNETDIDIALRITYSPPQNYATRKICPINWSYCASPEYLAAKGEPKTLLDLEQHDCLVYPRISDAWKYTTTDGEIKQLRIKNTIQANSSIVLLQAALMHQGIVHLPTYVLGEYIKSKQLRPLLMDQQLNLHEYFLYTLYFPSRYNSPKVRTFIDFLLERLSHPYWDLAFTEES